VSNNINYDSRSRRRAERDNFNFDSNYEKRVGPTVVILVCTSFNIACVVRWSVVVVSSHSTEVPTVPCFVFQYVVFI